VNGGTARTTLANSTPGVPINLGTNTGGSVGLTQTELNNVTAGVLQVGSATAGPITISTAITSPAATLTLATAGGVAEAGPASLTVPNLRLSTTATGFAQNVLNDGIQVSVLSADVRSELFFSDKRGLVVGAVDGDVGIISTDARV